MSKHIVINHQKAYLCSFNGKVMMGARYVMKY